MSKDEKLKSEKMKKWRSEQEQRRKEKRTEGKRSEEERRKELTKVASQYAENSKIAIRNIRRDIIEDIRKKHKNSEISEDDKHKDEDITQKITDTYIGNIDKILEKKEKEILDIS